MNLKDYARRDDAGANNSRDRRPPSHEDIKIVLDNIDKEEEEN